MQKTSSTKNLIDMEVNNAMNRRNWIRQSTLGAGALMLGSQVIPWTAKANPAFGMTPLNKPLLAEPFRVIEGDLGPLKARLLANENPYGPSKPAIQAIKDSAELGNRYVYNSSMEFAKTLAAKEGVEPNQVLIAPGSTDILEKFAFATCMNGGNVISADPGYMSIVNTARSIGATWKNIPLKADYSHDLKAMEKAVDSETKLVYICNPNNPTGTITPLEEIKAFAKKVSKKCPVFIDEAYLELMDDGETSSTVGLVAEGYDVVVCRTFSKIYGMAGLRVGYMVASPDRVKMIQELVRTEMGISVTSLHAAIASVADKEFPAMTKKLNAEARSYVFNSLQDMGFNPIKSHTSFILYPIDMSTKEFADKMLDKGVGIRVFTINDKPYSRVSMGTMDEVKYFVDTLKQITS